VIRSNDVLNFTLEREFDNYVTIRRLNPLAPKLTAGKLIIRS